MLKILRNIFTPKKHDLTVYVPYQPQAASELPTETDMRQAGSRAAYRPPTEKHQAIAALESKLRTSISGGEKSITERRSKKATEANNILSEYERKLDKIKTSASEESNVDVQAKRELMDDFDRICKDYMTANKGLRNFIHDHKCDESIKRGVARWWKWGMFLCICAAEFGVGFLLGLEIFQADMALVFTGGAVLLNVLAGICIAWGAGRLNYRKYAPKPVLAMLAGLGAWVGGLAIFGLVNMVFIAQRIADKQLGKGAEEVVTMGQILWDAMSNPLLIVREFEAIDLILIALAFATLALAFKFGYDAFGRREANPFLWKHMDAVIEKEKEIKKKNRAASRETDKAKKKELKKLDKGGDEIGAIEGENNNLRTAWIADSEKYHAEEREVKEKAKDLAAAYFKSYNEIRMQVKKGDRLPNNKLDEWQSRLAKLDTNIINDTDEAKVSDVISRCDNLKKSCVEMRGKLKERTETINKRWSDVYIGLRNKFDEKKKENENETLGGSIGEMLGGSEGNGADFSDERDRT